MFIYTHTPSDRTHSGVFLNWLALGVEAHQPILRLAPQDTLSTTHVWPSKERSFSAHSQYGVFPVHTAGYSNELPGQIM